MWGVWFSDKLRLSIMAGSRCTIWGHFLARPWGFPTDLLLSLWRPVSMFRCTDFYELAEVKACCGAVVRVAPDTWTDLCHDFNIMTLHRLRKVCLVCWEPWRDRHVPEEFWRSVVIFLDYYNSQLLLCFCSTCPDVEFNHVHSLNWSIYDLSQFHYIQNVMHFYILDSHRYVKLERCVGAFDA